MGGFPPMQGQEPMPQDNGYNGFGGGNMDPTPAMNQPMMQPQMATMAPQPGIPGQMPAPTAAPAPVPYPPADTKSKNTLIETIILVVVCIIAAVAIVFAVLYFMRWNDLNTNYTAEKDRAVAEAVKEQRDADDEALKERLKADKESFVGPDDFGRISFNYPKIWSVYNNEDGLENSDYSSYFAPAPVPSLNDQSARYAIRFQILNQSYDNVANNYSSAVQEGELTAENFQADSGKITGTKYTGTLEEGIEGIMVLAKVNDKTLILRTDSLEYTDDFNKILGSLRRGN